VWFWLFCGALFSDGFRLRGPHAIPVAAMAVAGTAYQLVLPPFQNEASPVFLWILGSAFGLASLSFVGLGVAAIRAGGRSDLDERRRRIRAWVGPAAAVYLAVVVAVQAWALYAGRSTPGPLVLVNLAIIDALAALALVSFIRVRVVNWLDLVEPAPAIEHLSRLERSVLDELDRRLVPERLYAREALTIAALAGLLGTQEHVLRRVINRGLGFRNFNDFLHTHRLREASVRLRDPTAARVPVLTIALEAGYGSIGPFNRAFRERFGMTPTEYRGAALDDARRSAADGELRHGLPRQGVESQRSSPIAESVRNRPESASIGTRFG
jgi:AraC-like DNA-binding protein